MPYSLPELKERVSACNKDVQEMFASIVRSSIKELSFEPLSDSMLQGLTVEKLRESIDLLMKLIRAYQEYTEELERLFLPK